MLSLALNGLEPIKELILRRRSCLAERELELQVLF